jgi:hypothetical protein
MYLLLVACWSQSTYSIPTSDGPRYIPYLMSFYETKRDIAKYQEIFSSFGIPALNDRFEMLRQLGNIFVVKPEILPSILSKDFLARIDPKALHPYLRMREDFKSAKIDHLLGMTDNPTRPSAMTSDGTRSQRLSMYVSDHNVMKQMMNSHSKADFLAAFNM